MHDLIVEVHAYYCNNRYHLVQFGESPIDPINSLILHDDFSHKNLTDLEIKRPYAFFWKLLGTYMN